MKLNNYYYLKQKMTFYDENNNEYSLEKGRPVKLVEIGYDRITLEYEEKKLYTIIGKSAFGKKLQKGNATLQEDEIYLMIYDSGWRCYISIGYDFDDMAKSILKKFNAFCEEKSTFKSLANEEDGFAFNVHKVKFNKAAFDTEYKAFGDENYVGDYLNKYRTQQTLSQNRFLKSFEKWI